jgi:AcrR family transcriptional regulator
MNAHKHLVSEWPESARRILDTAERLFAFHGIEGVSLRTISKHAGHRNNYAIQYHFKSKSGLLNAIFADRYMFLQQRMGEILASFGTHHGVPQCRDLLTAVLMPTAELVDKQGQRVHARFLLQFLTQFTPWTGVTIPPDRKDDTSAMRTLWKQLQAQLDYLPSGLLRTRLVTISRMFYGALVEWENAQLRGDRVLTFDCLIDDLLDMACAALTERPQPSVIKAVRVAGLRGLGE